MSSPGRVKFPEVFRDLFTPSRYKAFHGGRGGAKSHSFAQALVLMAARKPLRILCARETQKSIKDSVKRLLDDKIRQCGLSSFYESTENEIRGANGSLFVFAGLRTNLDAIRSLEGIDIAWVEEAHACSQASIDVLVPTIRRPESEIWFSWNPRKADDPVDKMFRDGSPPPSSIVREVNWYDNPWFPDVSRAAMEWDRGRDPDKYAHVWGGGYVVHSEAQVFKNWTIGEADIPAGARPYYGGDWGFAVDPSVLVRMWLVGPRTIYIDAEAYRVGCPIDETPALFDGVDDGDARRWPITADSARPETIDYMRRHGYPHIVGAIKGPGSLEDGVEFLKSYDIIVHPSCKYTIDELTYYSYKVEAKTDKVLPILEDKKNHVIDACRYALESVRMAAVGAGTEQKFLFDPSKLKVLPDWPRCYGLDVDVGHVSAVWGAYDPQTDTVYLYGEYDEDNVRTEVWASAIRRRSRRMPGVFAPRARGRTADAGERLVEQLLDAELDLYAADEADTEAAANEINTRIVAKQLRVAEHLEGWLAQYRAWRRDRKGAIVEDNDGLIQATGLLLVEGLNIACVDERVAAEVLDDHADLNRNPITGY